MTDALTSSTSGADANGFPEERSGRQHPDAADRPGDPMLRHGLDHAPDHSALPDDELRQAIRTFAHEAAAPSLPERRAGFLRRVSGGGGTGLEARANARRSRRLLRNLAVAAILLAILATATWHREPGPVRRPDVVTSPPPAVEATPPSAPDGASTELSTSAASASSLPDAAVSGAVLPPLAQASGALSASDSLFAPRSLPPSPSPPVPSVPAMTPPVATAPTPAPASRAASAVSVVPVVPVIPVPPTAPAAPIAAVPPTAPAAVERPAARTPAPPAPTTRTADMPPPSFVALSQWTHLTLSRANGESRRLPKSEVRELGALLGSAALSAAGPDPLASRIEWRIALDRNGQPLARMELAGGQVRWTENGTLPAAGTPPLGALSGLRQMLEASLSEPTAAASEGAVSMPVDPPATVPER